MNKIYSLFPIWMLLLVTGCTLPATSYGPMQDGFGYEETRLQENVYRISFKANRTTEETAVLDYLYLRAAELTQAAGFSHFLVIQDLGKSQREGRRSGFSVGLGFSSGMRSSFWGAGVGMPMGEDASTIRYHLGVFVIRMLTPKEATTEKDAFEAIFLEKNVREKLTRTNQPGS